MFRIEEIHCERPSLKRSKLCYERLSTQDVLIEDNIAMEVELWNKITI